MPVRLDSPTGAVYGCRQTFRLDWFQQVIDRVDVKRLDRVLVVGGDEDEMRLDSGSKEPPRHLEPGQTGHLHIEHDEIWRLFVDDPQRFDPVGRLPDDFDIVELAQQKAQFLPRQLFVVHDDRSKWQNFRRHAVILAGTTSSGITIRAQVPSPGTLSSCSW